ncbi:hypothetical protein [Streptomyces sp. BP-8]|uniref:Uncharacterized protein n=1 Tax=Streptomyces sirii TaxID=3127701 RepID=A0ABZ2QI88_9ACTN
MSFDLTYEIRDTNRLHVEATTTIVAYNLDTSRTRRLSDLERDFLARYTVPWPQGPLRRRQ